MKIYTRQGDKGTTQVYTDKALRLPKDDTILECYGTLDELNAHVGLLVSQLTPSDLDAQLEQIQRNLFQIGFAISASTELTEHDVQMLESQIDAMTSALEPQTSFIIPGGCQKAAQAHVCRTVARRAERVMVALSEQHDVNPVVMQYVNRLSDYFFVVARKLNHQENIADVKV